MRQKLIKEANSTGRNWREEIKTSVAPDALIELSKEHEEQEKGVENTESFLNEIENELRKIIGEAPLRDFSDFTGRSTLHKLDHDKFNKNPAADIGGEALARGRKPLVPTEPRTSILSEENPYPDFKSRRRSGFFSKLLKLFSSENENQDENKEDSITVDSSLLSPEKWKKFILRADKHLKFYEFDLERHLDKEDKVLFPSIEALGGEWKKVSLELYDQHAQQRDFIKSCRSYWTRANSVFDKSQDPEVIEKECLVFFRVLDTYLQHLVGHFDYEENEVFEPALATLNEELLEEIKKAWEIYQTEIKEPEKVQVPEHSKGKI
jgi:hemerythrin-like domain-containing protein